MYLAPDVFSIPAGTPDSFILYAPLLGVAAHVNGQMAALVEALKLQTQGSLTIGDDAARRELLALGVVAEQPYPALAPDSRDEVYAPTSVSLFLTSACNLGCTYCYASANENPQSLPWPIAKRALDLVLDNARQQKARSIGVTLHGGGEASLEWELLQLITEYAREAARAAGLTLKLSIGTNGVMPEARARWLARNLHSATVSLDGMRETHDKHRPTAGGGSNYDVVLRTLRVFDEERFEYGVRVTVTDDWVEQLPQAIASICDAAAAHHIQVEPVFPVGRAARNQLESPEAARFVRAFREAREVARARGRRLSYSGARLGTVTDRFCGAPGKSFAVTPAGDVSSCYEVSESSDSRSSEFFWGKYDASGDAFILDERLRKKQTRMTVHGKAPCADCYCKWHCAGDCSAKLATLGDVCDTSLNPRCVVNRALTRDQLVRAIQGGLDLSSSSAEEHSGCES